MITRINDLQSPFFGQTLKQRQPLKHNAAIEYEEDDEVRICIFFSQEQGLAVLDQIESASVCGDENYADRIIQCGLSASSEREPVTIRGAAARVFHLARIACATTPIVFSSNSVARVLVFLKTFEESNTVCILFVIDNMKARHLYVVHGQDEARSVLEDLRDIGPPGSHETRLEQIERSELAERAEEPTIHIEHDAVWYLGMHIECFWMLLTTRTSKQFSD